VHLNLEQEGLLGCLRRAGAGATLAQLGGLAHLPLVDVCRILAELATLGLAGYRDGLAYPIDKAEGLRAEELRAELKRRLRGYEADVEEAKRIPGHGGAIRQAVATRLVAETRTLLGRYFPGWDGEEGATDGRGD
jgi:hypothetical protein